MIKVKQILLQKTYSGDSGIEFFESHIMQCIEEEQEYGILLCDPAFDIVQEQRQSFCKNYFHLARVLFFGAEYVKQNPINYF